MADAKRALRRSMRRRRESMSPERAAIAAREVADRFLALPACRQVIARGGLVALYAAMRNEIDPAPIGEALAEAGVTLAYPRVVRGVRRLTFHRVTSPAEMEIGTFGIPEPPHGAPVAPTRRIDLFVVPGLAFDRDGNRLGWGMGHYDATLSENPEARRVGLAYESQIVDSVPRGPHDLPMHVIVTDTGVIAVR
jgi:5-formyltetrahydrofolate cyclo-ligase